MSCSSCGSNGGSPGGCKNNGYCQSGGCSKLEVYDWLADISLPNHLKNNVHEISFKNGSRKGFFKNHKNHEILTGDQVLVESSIGYDIGTVSLSGPLVEVQMRKKGFKSNSKDIGKIIRAARSHELEKMKQARSREKETMLRARIISRELGLDMKLGDVEFQADLRKATFYYTAEGRVDFRELIKVLAKEFRVKIEMRQIGSRQEAGKVGGIGSCGRELCCSTWLTSFKSVNTTAARYQNLSINQTKLSGQCGRLKCCLNYELDTYMKALEDFPEESKSKRIETENGTAYLFKTDILTGVMIYSYNNSPTNYPIPVEKVKEILEINKSGKKIKDLLNYAIVAEEEDDYEYEDLVGSISLKPLKKERKKKGRKSQNKRKSNSENKGSRPQNKKRNNQMTEKKEGEQKSRLNKNRRKKNLRNKKSKPNNSQGGRNDQNKKKTD